MRIEAARLIKFFFGGKDFGRHRRCRNASCLSPSNKNIVEQGIDVSFSYVLVGIQIPSSIKIRVRIAPLLPAIESIVK